jgi:hypothetical protein
MKFFLVITLISMMSMNVSALSVDERRNQIIKIIDEELNEVSRLSRQRGNRDPDQLLRMSELYLEKARLIREKENQTYLAMTDDDRRKINRQNHFKVSAGYFVQANSICLQIVKNFPNYRLINDVYYILGFNAKEAGDMKTASNYFSKANSKSRPNDITKIKSQISQAEIHYNNKNYRQAIPLYEQALAKHKDQWWTKDSFNLAWCYFNVNNYNAAISKMQEVFNASNDKKFIDMRDQVERDIGLFFATAGKIDEGIVFYKKIGINFTDQLLRIAVTMKSKGQYTTAAKTLSYAIQYEKNEKRHPEIHIEQLALYLQFGKTVEHLVTAKKLFSFYKKEYLTENQIKSFIFQVGKMAATLQQQVASNTYERLPTQRRQKADQAIEYFEIQSVLEKNKAHEHYFHQGETSYVVGNYASAVTFYNKAFDAAILVKDSTIMNRSMDGLLASLGQASLANNIKEANYIPVYEKYITHYPTGKNANSVYQKLFKVYYDRKNIEQSKNVLDRFVKVYPNDWQTQEAMIAILMQDARNKKDNDQIRGWIANIDAGKYKVSKKYAQTLRELLTSMQIEDVQKDLKQGRKKEALVGYHKILEDPNSTAKSRINAKYNLAALYYELGAVDNTFEWSQKAIDEMSPEETLKFADSFLTISSYLFMRLEFNKSAVLASKIVNKLCKTNDRKKTIAFKNGSYQYLAEDNIQAVEQMIRLGEQCNVATDAIETLRFELLRDYTKTNAWNNFENHVNALARNEQNWPRLIEPLNQLVSVHASAGNRSQTQAFLVKRNQFYSVSLKKKYTIPLEALDVMVQDDLNKLLRLQNNILNTKLSFPFPIFQKAATQIRKNLDQMILDANAIQKVGSGEGIVRAYSVLIETHQKLAEKFRDFKPEKLTAAEESNIANFYSAMKTQAAELDQTAQNLKKQVFATIEKNQILSHKNSEALSDEVGHSIRYWYANKALLMDRGGNL